MGTIHVNTLLMRQMGQLLVQLDQQILDQIVPQIQSHIARLESDWQGITREQYEEEFQSWRAATNRLASLGEEIGRHLQETATRFEEVDGSTTQRHPWGR